ncbi:MAG: hypothetical protein IKA68_01865 [Clostridia bacterium]|nr:hypothetical protein [Clostridia bacterium]
MKKILYLYGSLLVALAQSFIFQSMLSVIFKYGLDSGNIIALVALIVVQVLLVLLDSRVRGYLWWYEEVLDFIVSPIRFILQAVTIVLYHIGGDRDFANRSKYDRHFPYWVMYILFSTDSLKVGSRSSYRPKKAKPHKTKAKKTKPAPPPAPTVEKRPEPSSEEIMTAISKRFNEKRYNHIQKLKGDLKQATVYIFGFLNWKEGWQSFDNYDLSKTYHKTANITAVYVDGVNFVCDPIWNEDGEPSIGGSAKLYLPKGTYYISVCYEIEIPAVDFPGIGAPNKIITNKGRRDGIEITVTDESTPMFVGAYANIGCRFTEYMSDVQWNVKAVKDLEWSLQSYSGVLSREQCKVEYNDDVGFEMRARGQSANLSY